MTDATTKAAAANEQVIRPARNLSGSLKMPGDKSISHRYAMLGAMAEGVTRVGNFSTGADCASSLACVAQLGARVSRRGNNLEIAGRAGSFREPAAVLDCGNSGSTMRMMTGLLAAQSGKFTLSGDQSLNRRPMERIRAPLALMGASISLTDGHAPIEVHGTRLNAISYQTPVPSAQVKTCVLFAGLQAKGVTSVRETVRTRDHGEVALKAFGASISHKEGAIEISGGVVLHAIDATVPGDLSSAAFFLCAAALYPESRLVFDHLGLNPTRAALLDVLRTLGARIETTNVEKQHGEMVGTIEASGAPAGLGSTEIRGGLTAQLIDELPVLAAIGPFTQGGVLIRDARELRIKESDRIQLVATNLRAMGATVEEFEDGLHVPGRQKLHGAEIDSGSDHRIAMAFSIAALRAEGDSLIRGAHAAAISFPEFFDFLDQVAVR